MNPSDAAKGPESQDWMFKLEDLLLGPVSGKTLIQKLNDGEVTRETPVARPGGAFRRLGEIEAFKLHLAKAEAKLRVEAESRHAIRSRVRTRNVKLAATLTCAAAGVAAAGWGAQWLAIHKPWKVQDPSINWEVLDDPTFGKIAISLPSITKASASKFAEDEVLLPDQPEKPTGAKPGRGAARPTSLASSGGPPRGADDISRPQFDSGAINEVVNSNKKSLFPCLVEEMRRRPGFAAKVPIEFAVGNEGRVVKLWIDHPDFKTDSSDLYRCMFTRLQQWKFASYQGERATVALAFNIGSR